MNGTALQAASFGKSKDLSNIICTYSRTQLRWSDFFSKMVQMSTYKVRKWAEVYLIVTHPFNVRGRIRRGIASGML
jgi:hypothetical protein